MMAGKGYGMKSGYGVRWLKRGERCAAAVAAAVLSVLLLAGCGAGSADNGAGASGLRDVKVVLDWTPNTNHTGLYVARQKGYFEEEGLNVDIIQPGAGGADAVVASGEVEFGVSYQESVTLARTQGVPLVSVAAVIQHNTSGFASPEALGIATPNDFEGKTYGGWGSPIEGAVIESLMQAAGADFSKVKVITTGDGDFFTAKDNGIDFMWIYYGWTGVESELRGEPLNVVYLTDYSEKLDYYTPVLVTNERRIAEDPELVGKFVRAAAKGYAFAVQQPEEAADILIEAVPELNAELVAASQLWLSPKYVDDAPRWGVQQLEVWENYAEWLDEHGLLDGEFDADSAFTNQFIPE